MQRSAETISPKITTIRSRILIPVCGIFVGFVILLGILHIFEQRQASVLAKHDCAEKSLFFSKIIILHSSNLEALDDTNSYWDDLVTFAKKPNMAWAKRNLDSIISPSSVDGLFVYNSSSKLIYATNTDDIKALHQSLVSESIVKNLIGNRLSSHFFIPYDGQVVEVYGKTVVPSNDQAHATKPYGYLFAVRLWDKEYLDTIQTMTDSKITSLPGIPNASPDESSTTGDVITYRYGCFDCYGKEILRIQLRATDPTFSALSKSSNKLIVYLSRGCTR